MRTINKACTPAIQICIHFISTRQYIHNMPIRTELHTAHNSTKREAEPTKNHYSQPLMHTNTESTRNITKSCRQRMWGCGNRPGNGKRRDSRSVLGAPCSPWRYPHGSWGYRWSRCCPDLRRPQSYRTGHRHRSWPSLTSGGWRGSVRLWGRREDWWNWRKANKKITPNNRNSTSNLQFCYVHQTHMY